MTRTVRPADVSRWVTVNAPPPRAFQVFTEGIARWWPPAHSIGKSPQKCVVMEPKTGGRWYEVGEDGSQCDWGRVLAWEPPSRVLLAWQINGQWQYDATLVTEIEVRFIAEGRDATRVELEHRNLERLGAAADAARAAFASPNGWGGLLGLFADAARDSSRA